MSITKAIYAGKYVYANDESLPEKVMVQCIYCGCAMCKKSFPDGKKGHYFACMPNRGGHKNEVCETYQKESLNMPVLPPSPEKFIASLLKTKGKSSVTPATPKIDTPDNPKSEDDGKVVASKIRSLSQLLKIGILREKPLEKIEGSDYRYIDYIILKKWVRIIWRDMSLPPIGLRIVEAMWVGSLNVNKKDKGLLENREKRDATWERRMARFLKEKKELWLTLSRCVNGKKYVRLCLDCKSYFADIRSKLFFSGEEDGKYNDCISRTPKVEVLVAAVWAIMEKEDCHDKCPLRMCDNCLGAYWGKCTSPKQVQLIDDKYKC